MKKRILNLLREENDFVSGQKISDELGVSRTAIWKHMKTLRNEGYEIQSISNKGYKIIGTPDVLTSSEISPYMKTKYIARNIVHFDTVDSTNKVAKELAVDEAIKDGTLVVSEEQTMGKGRLGRKWVSPKNKGIWMSLILKPEIEPSEAAIVTQIGAAAVYLTLKEMGLDALVKWPNDIVVNKKKVCGILTEMNAELSRINYIVMGIGINVNLDKEEIDDEIINVATSVKIEKGESVSRQQILANIMKHFEELYDDFVHNNNIDEAIQICKKGSAVIGEQITIIKKGEKISAKAIDLNKKGELLVQYEDGEISKVISGEVSIRGFNWYA